MANSVGAIRRGLDYQATFAWICICDMLLNCSCAESIQFESTCIKSFDDLVVCYNKSKPRESMATGRDIYYDYYQIKFHVAYDGVISFDNLMDPHFINAKKHSILQKLVAAVQKLGADACYYRFTLAMPWNLDPNDLLSEVLSTCDGEIIINKLFDGTGYGSKKGKLRKKLMQHMGIEDEDELKRILSLLRIQSNTWNEAQLVETLNFRLCALNLKPITSLNPYSQMLFKWYSQDVDSITRSFVLDECQKENLIIAKQTNPRIPVGIRSFYRGTENMQDMTESMLCLLPNFDGRFLKQGLSWDTDIKLKIDEYVKTNLARNKSYKIYLDTHYAIAFATGRALDSKSGIDIAPVQKTLNKPCEVWETNKNADIQYNDWVVNSTMGNETYQDIAIVFSATHPIMDEVAVFISQQGIKVHETIHFCLSPDPHHQSVIDGSHAFFLAQAASKIIYEKIRIHKSKRIHLFMAIPISLCFFLGQISLCWGTCTVYEYDFEKSKTYVPTITL